MSVTENMYKEFLKEGTHIVEVTSVNFGVVMQSGKNEGSSKCEIEVIIKETDNPSMIVEDEAAIMLIQNQEYPMFYGLDIQDVFKSLTGSEENLNGGTIEELLDSGVLVGRKLLVTAIPKEEGAKAYPKYSAVEGQPALKFKVSKKDPSNQDLVGIENSTKAKAAWDQDDVTIVNIKSVDLNKFHDQYKNKERTGLKITGEDAEGNLVSVSQVDIYNKLNRDFDTGRLTEIMVKLIKLGLKVPTSVINEKWDELKDQLLTNKINLEGISVHRLQTECVSKAGFSYKKKVFNITK